MSKIASSWFPQLIETTHARKRMQQRAIPAFIVGYLLDYADSESAGRGAERYAFTRKSWKRLCMVLNTQIKRIERYRDVYAIMEGDVLITVAWRH